MQSFNIILYFITKRLTMNADQNLTNVNPLAFTMEGFVLREVRPYVMLWIFKRTKSKFRHKAAFQI
jgi:hypothetical protein